MKITFLGTGTSQGVPVIACKCAVCASKNKKDKRLRCSVLIEEKGTHFVIDAGPDFRQQMLVSNVQQLDAILLTHGHKDHIAGLDDVRAFNYIQKKPADIYASTQVHEVIRREFLYAFKEEERYPGVPEMNLHAIDEKSFSIKNTHIIPIRVHHYRLPILGFRIGDFTYITDANRIDKEEMKKIEGSKIVVLNALRKQSHVSHYTLDEAVAVIQQLNPQKAYLTHISHLMGFHDEVEKELPKNIHLAHDGLTIEL